MLDVLDAHPSVGSWKCDPMTISEIDAHPDADRIWATIHAISGTRDSAYEEGYEAAESDAEDAKDDGYKEGREECAKELRNLLDDLVDALTPKVEAALELLADEWS